MNLRKFLTLASLAFGTIALCSITSVAQGIDKHIVTPGAVIDIGQVCEDETEFGVSISTEGTKQDCPEEQVIEEPPGGPPKLPD